MNQPKEQTLLNEIGLKKPDSSLVIELRCIQPRKPNQNEYEERFNKSVLTEVLNA